MSAIDLDSFDVERYTSQQRAYAKRCLNVDRVEANAELRGMEIVLREIQPLVEIAKAAKERYGRQIFAESATGMTEERLFAILDEDRRLDRALDTLVRQHLLPAAPSQPEEQG